MSDNVLLPCPHCNEANHLYLCVHRAGEKPYGIDCLGCGYEFVPRDGFDVVAMWNRRAPRWSAADALAAALRELVSAFPTPRRPRAEPGDDASERYHRQKEARAVAEAILRGAEIST